MRLTTSRMSVNDCIQTSEGVLRVDFSRLCERERWCGALFGALLLVAMIVALPASVCAADAGLDLQDAIERALGQNKELAAFQHRIGQQEGRREQANVLPNPEARVDVEDVGGTGAFKNTRNAQTTVSIGWVLEPGLRKQRVGVEDARSKIIRFDVEILEIEIAAETAQRFLDSLTSQARESAADEAVSLAQETVEAVSRRVKAGRVPRAEQTRAEAELAIAQLSRDDVTHELAIAYRRLAAQWGDTVPRFSAVVGDLALLPQVETFDSLVARIEQSPLLARLSNTQRLAEAKLGLARVDRWPKLRPSFGVRDIRTTKDTALIAGLSFELPVFDRNQGKIRESLASIERSRADKVAQRIRVHTTLFELYEEMQHFIHRAKVLRDEVIPRLEQALVEIRQGYERGRYDYLELKSVQADLLEAKRSLVEASAGAHRLVIALERLTGTRVAKG